MAELSFGEKLVIARRQLDLFSYQMAELLGVHPNSITKYERGTTDSCEKGPFCSAARLGGFVMKRNWIALLAFLVTAMTAGQLSSRAQSPKL